MPTKKELNQLEKMFRRLDKELDADYEDAVQAIEKALQHGTDIIGIAEDEDEDKKGRNKISRPKSKKTVPRSRRKRTR